MRCVSGEPPSVCRLAMPALLPLSAVWEAPQGTIVYMPSLQTGLFRLRMAGEVLQDDSDIEDKYVVWVKPPEWRAPRLTDIVLRCQAVLDQNRKDRRLPFSNKERKRKLTEFTDRRPPIVDLSTTTWPPRPGRGAGARQPQDLSAAGALGSLPSPFGRELLPMGS
ncbi:hypothetical protein Bbelb_048620 [Branchiostoma belcheri]|nr:hypothetical protein Bbelb_048620 [Branchiostoma belcheri]